MNVKGVHLGSEVRLVKEAWITLTATQRNQIVEVTPTIPMKNFRFIFYQRE